MARCKDYATKEQELLLVNEAINTVMDYLLIDNILYSHYSVAIPAVDRGEGMYWVTTFYLSRTQSGNSSKTSYVCWSPGILEDTWIVHTNCSAFTIERIQYYGLHTARKKAEVTKYRYTRNKGFKLFSVLPKRFKDPEHAYRDGDGHYIEWCGDGEDVL